MPAAPKNNPPLRRLLGPGPSAVNPRVLESLSLPVVGHLDPAFLQIMDQNMAMLREVFQTKNRLALPMSGTGSAGMETCFVNLIEPGDAVLIGVNGFFGTRMVDVAQRCGAQVGHGARSSAIPRGARQEALQTRCHRACRDLYRCSPACGGSIPAGSRAR